MDDVIREIAAAAESAGMPVCHYDADFDRVAVTGQPVRAIAPLGSLDRRHAA